MPTKIDWADEVWNPVTGCSKISPGCDHCYAERMAKRLAGRCGYPKSGPFQVTVHHDRADLPFKWRKPKRIFVNSMGDLFHKDVPDHVILNIWHVMADASQHTFMVLTKRPERMLTWMNYHAAYSEKNIWLGVTAENQETADHRIPILLQTPGTPGAVRFVSVEPMLGRVDLRIALFNGADSFSTMEGLDWVICGGETGPGARPINAEWVHSLRDQCVAADVPFFFKSWGSCSIARRNTIDGKEWREFVK